MLLEALLQQVICLSDCKCEIARHFDGLIFNLPQSFHLLNLSLHTTISSLVGQSGPVPGFIEGQERGNLTSKGLAHMVSSFKTI